MFRRRSAATPDVLRMAHAGDPHTDWSIVGDPVSGWSLGLGTDVAEMQSVHDNDLGTLLFPGHDQVMVPWIQAYGTWEPLERDWLYEHLRPGATFLNVGANVGYHTVLAAKVVGPTGHVFAVEPDPVNFAFLLANIAIHGLRNVTPIRAAAGSSRGELALHRSDDNSGDNRLNAFEGSSSSVNVPVHRMDELLGDVDLDVVLMDTQGWDHEVVAGMSGLLARRLPPMIVEFVPGWLRDRGIEPAAVIEDLVERGYDVGVLEEKIAPGTASVAEIVSAAESGDQWFANLDLQPRVGSPGG
jgi:FkbM family methyltransferase